MNENEEFEFRLRMEKEKASAAPPVSPVSAAITGAVKAPFLPMKLGSIGGDIYHQGSDVVGSAVTEGASRMGLPSEAAAGLGTAAYVGAQALPAVAGSVGQIAPTGLRAIPRRLMQSSIKPNAEARTSGAADKAITTMLEKGINATEAGMSATQSKVTSLENKIQGILDESPGIVDPYKAADNIKKAVSAVSLNLDRARNLRDIEKVYDKFVNHEAIKDMGGIPASLANKMKQAFYTELKDKAFVPGADLTVAAKAQKALAGGLRQEVAAAEPAVVPSLAEQSELINVLKVAGPQAAREGNKNILGFGALSPRLENVLVWMVDRYPWFKSMLARGLYAPEGSQAGVGIGVAAGEALSQQFNKK